MINDSTSKTTPHNSFGEALCISNDFPTKLNGNVYGDHDALKSYLIGLTTAINQHADILNRLQNGDKDRLTGSISINFQERLDKLEAQLNSKGNKAEEKYAFLDAEVKALKAHVGPTSDRNTDHLASRLKSRDTHSEDPAKAKHVSFTVDPVDLEKRMKEFETSLNKKLDVSKFEELKKEILAKVEGSGKGGNVGDLKNQINHLTMEMESFAMALVESNAQAPVIERVPSGLERALSGISALPRAPTGGITRMPTGGISRTVTGGISRTVTGGLSTEGLGEAALKPIKADIAALQNQMKHLTMDMESLTSKIMEVNAQAPAIDRVPSGLERSLSGISALPRATTGGISRVPTGFISRAGTLGFGKEEVDDGALKSIKTTLADVQKQIKNLTMDMESLTSKIMEANSQAPAIGRVPSGLERSLSGISALPRAQTGGITRAPTGFLSRGGTLGYGMEEIDDAVVKPLKTSIADMQKQIKNLTMDMESLTSKIMEANSQAPAIGRVPSGLERSLSGISALPRAQTGGITRAPTGLLSRGGTLGYGMEEIDDAVVKPLKTSIADIQKQIKNLTMDMESLTSKIMEANSQAPAIGRVPSGLERSLSGISALPRAQTGGITRAPTGLLSRAGTFGLGMEEIDDAVVKPLKTSISDIQKQIKHLTMDMESLAGKVMEGNAQAPSFERTPSGLERSLSGISGLPRSSTGGISRTHTSVTRGITGGISRAITGGIKEESIEEDSMKYVKDSISDLKNQIKRVMTEVETLSKKNTLESPRNPVAVAQASTDGVKKQDLEDLASKYQAEINKLKTSISKLEEVVKNKVEGSALDVALSKKLDTSDFEKAMVKIKGEIENTSKFDESNQNMQNKIERIEELIERRIAKIKKELDLTSLVKQLKSKAEDEEVRRGFESSDKKVNMLSETLHAFKKDVDKALHSLEKASAQMQSAYFENPTFTTKKVTPQQRPGTGNPMRQFNPPQTIMGSDGKLYKSDQFSSFQEYQEPENLPALQSGHNSSLLRESKMAHSSSQSPPLKIKGSPVTKVRFSRVPKEGNTIKFNPVLTNSAEDLFKPKPPNK